MATFTNPSAFAAHVAGYGQKIEGAQPAAVKAALEVAAIAIRQSGSRFKIKGRRGGRFALGAKVEGPYGYGGNWIGYVKADPAGMWAMVEEGTKPHDIRPRRRGGALAGIPYKSGIFAVVHHPGTQGPIGHPWAIGTAKAELAAAKAYEHALMTVVF